MNPKCDALVAEYEQLWRAAMLENRMQFWGGASLQRSDGSETPTCAWLIAPHPLLDRAATLPLTWRCPDCSRQTVSLADTLIHLNNLHLWTWDRFANKFRDTLKAGLRQEK